MHHGTHFGIILKRLSLSHGLEGINSLTRYSTVHEQTQNRVCYFHSFDVLVVVVIVLLLVVVVPVVVVVIVVIVLVVVVVVIIFTGGTSNDIRW